MSHTAHNALLPNLEGGRTASTNARKDLLHLFRRNVNAVNLAAVLEIDALDIDSALTRSAADQKVVKQWTVDQIRQFVDQFSSSEHEPGLGELFERYVDARKRILPLLSALAVEPLLVVAKDETRELVNGVVRAYGDLNAHIRTRYEELLEEFGQDVNHLLGAFLTLEVIVIKLRDRWVAVMMPTHPLYLWHFSEYGEVVAKQRDQLQDRDRELIVNAAESLPFFLPSLLVPPQVFGATEELPYSGRIGQIPHFGHQSIESASRDGIETIRSMMEAQLRFEPYAANGYRIELIDPPATGPFLEAVIDLKESGQLQGAHVNVIRRSQTGPINEPVSADAQDRIARVFNSIGPSRLFTYDVSLTDRRIWDLPVGIESHLSVAFDQSVPKKYFTEQDPHQLNPLASQRRIRYSMISKTVELEVIASGPFSDYVSLVRRLAPGPSWLAVHQSEGLRSNLRNLPDRASWIAIADRQVDRDLEIGTIRVVTRREGDRDVAGFARSTIPFRHLLRDVVRNYNAYVSDAEIDELLGNLSDLLDEGLLSLKPGNRGQSDASRVKGVLGTLVAARWFQNAGSAGDRMVVSLDGSDARRWLHLNDDPRRADLLGFEWTNGHCTVSVIEVKAVDAANSEYVIRNGDSNRSRRRSSPIDSRIISAGFR